jgi:hypothetical protein
MDTEQLKELTEKIISAEGDLSIIGKVLEEVFELGRYEERINEQDNG